MPSGPFVDYYKVLQVDQQADPEVIGAAYRKLAQRYHPDTSADPSAGTRMVEINAAWEVLGDPEKRRDYDRTRGTGSPASPGATPGPGPARRRDRPVLAITPDDVELRPRPGDDYATFSVSVAQVDGPAWVNGRHEMDIVFEDPWRPEMFTKIMPSSKEPPLSIEFELKTSELTAARRYSGGIRVEVLVIS